MSKRPPLRLHFAGLVFQFENKEQLYDWMTAMIAYSTDRRGLYEALMCDATQAAIEMCAAGTKEAEADSIRELKSLKVIADKYGKIYDPQGEIFKIEEDANQKLQV